jgi:phosphatidylglycerophosphate synthase
LIAMDSLGHRRLGVVLFQFRTFLDDLDGHVARASRNIRGERSEIGTMGYYVDGICDGLGCIALMIGVFVFLRNNVSWQLLIPLTDQTTKLNQTCAFSLHDADTRNYNQ